MHRCLQIHEVLERIAEYLAENPPPDGHDFVLDWPEVASAAVLAFALTCRTFCKPGLDVLWRKLEELYPLPFAFQPGINLTTKNEDGDTTVTNLSGIPRPDDWARFSRYANRVRILGCDSLGRRHIDARILALLSITRPSDYILPNLQHLSWHDPRPEYSIYSLLFICPALTDIDITVASDTVAMSLLDTLRYTAPALRYVSLSLEDFEASKATQDLLSQALRSWKNLCSFRLCEQTHILSLSRDDVLYLSRLANLRDFEATLEEETFIAVLATEPRPFFPSLTSLDLHACNSRELLVAGKFTQAVQTQALKTIRIGLSEQPTALSVTTYLEKAVVHHRLTSLALHLYPPVTFHSDAYVLTEQAITPVFALKSLESLHLGGFPSRFTKDTFQKMAQLWPALEHLDCGDRVAAVPMSIISVVDLEPFALYCPKLKTASLPLNIILPAGALHPTRRHARRVSDVCLTIRIGNSRIQDALKMAAYLTSMFPKVDVMPGFHSLDTRGEMEVKRLRYALEVLIAVRGQERLITLGNS
ncbi:unnamed protein product [Somion occarium]|uniref:F-box domain-containing protein n=1 Tax=Somion occarium TaxID=3059160 RepID=A0ABP1E2F5_9APHY